jgi:ABC-2 type transport system ATP-binding protein
VSDLERVASHVTFLHESRVLLTAALDELPERHARLIIPATLAQELPTGLTGELSRRKRADGGMTIVIVREQPAPLDIERLPGVRSDALRLEDLFIEVAG